MAADKDAAPSAASKFTSDQPRVTTITESLGSRSTQSAANNMFVPEIVTRKPD